MHTNAGMSRDVSPICTCALPLDLWYTVPFWGRTHWRTGSCPLAGMAGVSACVCGMCASVASCGVACVVLWAGGGVYVCVCAVVLCLVVGMVRVCGYVALCVAVVAVCAAVLLPCLAACRLALGCWWVVRVACVCGGRWVAETKTFSEGYVRQ